VISKSLEGGKEAKTEVVNDLSNRRIL